MNLETKWIYLLYYCLMPYWGSVNTVRSWSPIVVVYVHEVFRNAKMLRQTFKRCSKAGIHNIADAQKRQYFFSLHFYIFIAQYLCVQYLIVW